MSQIWRTRSMSGVTRLYFVLIWQSKGKRAPFISYSCSYLTTTDPDATQLHVTCNSPIHILILTEFRLCCRKSVAKLISMQYYCQKSLEKRQNIFCNTLLYYPNISRLASWSLVQSWWFYFMVQMQQRRGERDEKEWRDDRMRHDRGDMRRGGYERSRPRYRTPPRFV